MLTTPVAVLPPNEGREDFTFPVELEDGCCCAANDVALSFSLFTLLVGVTTPYPLLVTDFFFCCEDDVDVVIRPCVILLSSLFVVELKRLRYIMEIEWEFPHAYSGQS